MLELPVTFRAEARDDLARIFAQVLSASASLTVTERYLRRIRVRCARIGRLPFGGRPRDDLEPGLRLATFERSIVIAYRVEPDRVEITNLFERGRDHDAAYISVRTRRP